MINVGMIGHSNIIDINIIVDNTIIDIIIIYILHNLFNFLVQQIYLLLCIFLLIFFNTVFFQYNVIYMPSWCITFNNI